MIQKELLYYSFEVIGVQDHSGKDSMQGDRELKEDELCNPLNPELGYLHKKGQLFRRQDSRQGATGV